MNTATVIVVLFLQMIDVGNSKHLRSNQISLQVSNPTKASASDKLICIDDPNIIDILPLLGTTPNFGIHSTISHQFVLNDTTLRETLQFNPLNENFNKKFFQSMDGRVINPDHETPGQSNYLFLVLKIKRDDLDKHKFTIKWSVDTGGKYTSALGTRSDPSIFGRTIVGDEQTVKDCDNSTERCTYYTAQCHASSEPSCPNGMKRGGDNIMVSPGVGTKMVNMLGDDIRNRQVGDYMSSWAAGWGYKVTSYQEKCQIWSVAGKIAIERLEGKLDRRKNVHTVEEWPMSVYRMRDNVDEQGNPGEGLSEVTIYTHGRGVPWLHIRIESYMQHPSPSRSIPPRN